MKPLQTRQRLRTKIATKITTQGRFNEISTLHNILLILLHKILLKKFHFEILPHYKNAKNVFTTFI